MPVWPVLTSLTHRRQLPSAVYVLIDTIDTTHRVHELSYSADFWLAVQQELLSQAKAIAPFSDRADHTVVTGQNSSGLPTLYVGLHWPERFGYVLSQSGSYRWPHRGGHQEGVLLKQLNTGEVSVEGPCIVLKVDVREPVIMQANRALYVQLHPLKESIFRCQVGGEYGVLCWRGGLMQGLIDLWQSLFHDRS